MQLEATNGFSIKEFTLFGNDNHFRFGDWVNYDSLPPVIPFGFIENSLLDFEPNLIQSI